MSDDVTNGSVDDDDDIGIGSWGMQSNTNYAHTNHVVCYISRYHNGFTYYFVGMVESVQRKWSRQMNDGMLFATVDHADDYISDHLWDIANDLLIETL